jgi:AraC-like DNA-binding protein
LASLLLPRAQHVVSYHVIRTGSCWAGLLDEPPLCLETGDILVVPHGDAYFMSSAPDLYSTAPPTDAVLTFFRQMTTASAPTIVIEGGGGPERVDIVCGFLGCDVRPFNPVLESLPRVVHVRRTSDAAEPDRLAQLIEFALAESRQGDPGAKCVLLHLSEILFVEVVRRCVEAPAAEHTGWLAGLRDPLVGRALACLHDRPSEAWTLERLAKDVGASRSALADRFTHLVGRPPMRYLTEWRLQLATGLLSNGAAKVSAVARDVGYESEAAFSRAFKKRVGTSPAAWRRQSITPHDGL